MASLAGPRPSQMFAMSCPKKNITAVNINPDFALLSSLATPLLRMSVGQTISVYVTNTRDGTLLHVLQ